MTKRSVAARRINFRVPNFMNGRAEAKVKVLAGCLIEPVTSEAQPQQSARAETTTATINAQPSESRQS